MFGLQLICYALGLVILPVFDQCKLVPRPWYETTLEVIVHMISFACFS